MCFQLQHSEEARGGDLNHTAALVTENIFLQGPSRPLFVLQGRIRGNLITVKASPGPMGSSHVVLWQELCAGNRFGQMK